MTGAPAARARSIVTFALAQVAVAVVLVLVGVVRLPAGGGRDAAGVVLGIAAGCALYYVLAYDPAAKRIAAQRSAVLRLAALLASVAVAEEILWRGFALESLRSAIGPIAALAATTIGFAAAHAAAQGWSGIRTHLVTGLIIGLAYVVTGSLIAAVVTHLSYNLLFLRTIAPHGRLFS